MRRVPASARGRRAARDGGSADPGPLPARGTSGAAAGMPSPPAPARPDTAAAPRGAPGQAPRGSPPLPPACPWLLRGVSSACPRLSGSLHREEEEGVAAAAESGLRALLGRVTGSHGAAARRRGGRGPPAGRPPCRRRPPGAPRRSPPRAEARRAPRRAPLQLPSRAGQRERARAGRCPPPEPLRFPPLASPPRRTALGSVAQAAPGVAAAARRRGQPRRPDGPRRPAAAPPSPPPAAAALGASGPCAAPRRGGGGGGGGAGAEAEARGRWSGSGAAAEREPAAAMDESSLLDLLECSVCLERLDTTAKVLPCQHTFCRRCLESIVSSRHELRCPECRILVGCGVDELPANILLVRLLDGIRQRPRAAGGASGSPSTAAPTYPQPAAAPSAVAAAAASAAASLRELAAASRSALLGKNVSQLPYGKALYTYEGKEPGDLKFNKGDIIILRRKVDENWYHGELNGNHGFFPASYIQCIKPLPQAPPQGKALYDFEIKDKDQDKDCLTFTKDEILTVIRRVDDNWAEGMLGDKIGIFPILYVEDSSLIGTATVAGPRTSAIIGDQGTPPKVQLPLNIYLALYAYKPQKNDELELRKGEMYRVIEKCQDGWFKGTSLRSGMSGVFPGNYVTPVSRVPVGAGQPRNSGAGGVPTTKVAPGAIHPIGASHTNVTTTVRPVVPITTPQTHPQLQAASPQLNNCLRYSAQQPASQPRSTMQIAHPTVPAPDRPTATVSPLRTPSSPSRLPAAAIRPHPAVSPQHGHQPPAPGARPLIPLTSAAAAITPPNVSAAHLNGEVGSGPLCAPVTPGPASKAEERKNEKKEKKSGLLKLLAGASTKKKSRSPPSVSPTHDPQTAIEGVLQGAVGPELSSLSSHGRAGSCPIESEMQGAMGLEPLHRKTGSLDLNFSIPSPARPPLSSMAAIRPEPKPLPRERYRVVVPYPPQSEAEIELKEGDIVFVHKKREDGWYKGTLQRNGRTGLFPGSFVESF
ncbi:E3 ubiquitin-protein ligase SH3RF3 isoform X2 [Pseudopipra pipra]|uniref:E3 ubiquitin-protein ligase SH3RF3 isoform X2 n=1 Tax=Pseudopipra pipra TaxID=415032 RepID=UPI0031396D4D